MNPLDDYLGMKKEAFFGQLLSGMSGQLRGEAAETLGGKMMGGALTALGGAAVAGLGAAAMKVHDAVTKRRDFKQMMAVDPDLAQLQAEKPKFFNQAYSSLRNINPAFGKDPLVAGSYMRKMMANPDAAGLTLAQSVKAPTLPGAFKPMPLGESLYSPESPEQQEMNALKLYGARRKDAEEREKFMGGKMGFGPAPRQGRAPSTRTPFTRGRP